MQDTKEKPGTKTEFVGLRVIRSQVELLDRCCKLTGQTRTDLVREALAGFLPRLYQRLTGGSDEAIR